MRRTKAQRKPALRCESVERRKKVCDQEGGNDVKGDPGKKNKSMVLNMKLGATEGQTSSMAQCRTERNRRDETKRSVGDKRLRKKRREKESYRGLTHEKDLTVPVEAEAVARGSKTGPTHQKASG